MFKSPLLQPLVIATGISTLISLNCLPLGAADQPQWGQAWNRNMVSGEKGLAATFDLTTGSNNIDVGNAGVAGESSAIRIGTVGTQTATFIAGIRGTPITGGLAVGITTDGQLGVKASSARFKEAIKPMDKFRGRF